HPAATPGRGEDSSRHAFGCGAKAPVLEAVYKAPRKAGRSECKAAAHQSGCRLTIPDSAPSVHEKKRFVAKSTALKIRTPKLMDRTRLYNNIYNKNIVKSLSSPVLSCFAPTVRLSNSSYTPVPPLLPACARGNLFSGQYSLTLPRQLERFAASLANRRPDFISEE